MIDSSIMQAASMPPEQAMTPPAANSAQGSDNNNSQSSGDQAQALALSRDAYAGAHHASASSAPGTAERLLSRLDQLDHQFVKSMTNMPDVSLAEAGTPEGMWKLSTELLAHQAQLTRASIGISMVSSGTTSFRDGVKQVLTSQ